MLTSAFLAFLRVNCIALRKINFFTTMAFLSARELKYVYFVLEFSSTAKLFCKIKMYTVQCMDGKMQHTEHRMLV